MPLGPDRRPLRLIGRLDAGPALGAPAWRCIEHAIAHRQATWGLSGNRFCLALACLRIGNHRYQSATPRTGRDIAFSAHPFLRARRALDRKSVRVGKEW